ncbi:hypothetical protein CHL76_15165 [Marinococcus halophilus]|uniref:Uncharacterized protein n=1 Tax=Marinococcus halophilus TaxID=1371 RepID=A0A510Y7C6_MARHA|nr:hypothetical protein [Marinococcus halophilus]OZT78964.1 hypothetical protein CHL76_15165 [Marinococcus halophilus]GEK58591.1 hypothetical protein MHA01_14960 [Marinococcus halophilus]
MKNQYHAKRIAPGINDLFVSIIQNVMKELTGTNIESQLDVVKCVKKHWKKVGISSPEQETQKVVLYAALMDESLKAYRNIKNLRGARFISLEKGGAWFTGNGPKEVYVLTYTESTSMKSVWRHQLCPPDTERMYWSNLYAGTKRMMLHRK